jgi:hypothetical protein
VEHIARRLNDAMKIASVILGLGLLSTSAHAATINQWVNPNGKDIDIVIKGTIELEDSKKFQDQIYDLSQRGETKRKRIVVDLQSDGGSLVGGLEIAQQVRDGGFVTWVGKSKLCASVCAIIWLAGKDRYTTDTSLIGFHAAYDVDTNQESGRANAILGSKLSQWGYNTDFIAYVATAGPHNILFFSEEAAQKYAVTYGGKLPTEAYIQIVLQEATKTVKPEGSPSAPPPGPAANVLPSCSSAIVINILRKIGARYWIELYGGNAWETSSNASVRYCTAMTYSSRGKRWLNYYVTWSDHPSDKYWVQVTGYSRPLW